MELSAAWVSPQVFLGRGWATESFSHPFLVCSSASRSHCLHTQLGLKVDSWILGPAAFGSGATLFCQRLTDLTHPEHSTFKPSVEQDIPAGSFIWEVPPEHLPRDTWPSLGLLVAMAMPLSSLGSSPEGCSFSEQEEGHRGTYGGDSGEVQVRKLRSSWEILSY